MRQDLEQMRKEAFIRSVDFEPMTTNAGDAFIEISRAMLHKELYHIPKTALAFDVSRRLVEKAAAALSTDEAWASAEGQAMSQAFVNLIAEVDVISLVSRYGVVMPNRLFPALAAAGYTADIVNEGAPIAVRIPSLQLLNDDPRKAAGLVVMTDELARAKDADKIYADLLTEAVIVASNRGAVGQLTSVLPLDSTGDGALADLKLALSRAAPSGGYVAVADPAIVRELALESDGRMDITGGEFLRGLHIVTGPEADSGTPSLRLIPAARCAVRDLGLSVQRSSQAAIDMRDSPSSPAQAVSLFQTNSKAILVYRQFSIACSDAVIEVWP